MFKLNDFNDYKKNNKKITMVTAYDYFSAHMLEKALVDTILVGDSLGMVFSGEANTLKVTVDNMIYHGQAVRRGAPNSFIIIDMPYLSYHLSTIDSVRNAGRIMQETNANAVKIEVNNIATLEHIEAIIAAQIPVIAHIGMTPQSVNIFGGFKVQGKNEDSIQNIINFANALTKINVSAVVLECIPADIAKEITRSIDIATIGIGAGVHCDGQVLVFHDMLGFSNHKKIKFVKKYVDAYDYLISGIKDYVTEVKEASFPSLENTY